MQKIIMRNEFVPFALVVMLCVALTGCPKPETLVDEEPVVVDTSEEEALEEERMKAEEEQARQLEEERMKQLEIEETRRLELEREDRMRIALEGRDIYFEFDQYRLTSAARALLQEKGDYLMANSDVAILIEGHCDERGTVEYNLALGDRRAKSARDYLLRMGVSPTRVDTISYGEEMPADPGHHEGAWTKNRRCRFVVTHD